MSENCLSQNPLVRDGTSRRQRLLKTLLPSYAPVDERSMKDLVNFARKFAGEINYFESDSAAPDGEWDDFFRFTDRDWQDFSLEEFIQKLKETGEAAPHLALFLGFLYMFKTAQDDLNTLTRRHLEFYYRDVLQLEQKAAVSDQVSVIFRLAKHVDRHLVKEGTALKAGKDALGVERIYEVERDLVVSEAEIASLKTVFVDINDRFSSDLETDPEVSHRIFKSPVADSADGLGADIETEEKSWRTFGEPHFPKLGTSAPDSAEPDRKQAEVGFALASPILFMAEGDRTVTLKVTLEEELDETVDPEDFKILFSGEKEWISAEITGAAAHPVSSDYQLVLTCRLTPADPAVVRCNPEELEDPFSTNWPVIKVLLDPGRDRNPFSYSLFRDCQATNIHITVDVEGVKNLVLQNDQAVLDAGKPFLPFGNRPYVGSNFYIGSREVFRKKLSSLDVKFRWNDLPQHEEGFKDHYKNYQDSVSGWLRSNHDFQIDIDILDEKNWHQLRGNTYLLTDGKGDPLGNTEQLPGPDADRSTLSVSDNPDLENITRDSELGSLTGYNVDTQKGFLRITLKNQDFGHNSFQNSYAKKAIDLAKGGSGDLPRQPYTPVVQDLSLSYVSKVDYPLTGEADKVEQFFHIEPFGVWAVDGSLQNTPLMPRFTHEGNLYVGISDLQPPQSLSVLFQVAEGSANPVKASPDIEWSYLSNNEWRTFDQKSILFNTTNDLLTSGIIRFAFPKDATDENNRLPAGKHWVKASVEANSDAVCRLIDVRAQAVLARFEDRGNDPDHLKDPLEAETINKLLRSDSAIDSVMQPYASFGGKVKEQQSAFYTRTSERLRHKQRAIAIWDYEHIILQRFPSVYKVKCINHTRFGGNLTDYSEMAPGHVTCIVVSNVQNKNAVDPLRPMTSLNILDEIDRYLQTIISESVDLHVKNPIYEEVMADFSVKFRSPDTGFYKQKLQEDLKEYLAPWSSDCGTDISFSGRIHKSMILNFVEERPYVDYVSCFKMYHIVPTDPENNSSKDVEEIRATTAVSILGSAESHKINVIDFSSEDCDCEDNVIKSSEEWISADDCPCQEEITSLSEESTG
ncbi:baseplate J/gp47 family protein [Fodinibius sediminis]|uniref:Baseplate J-like protein n=1 Tax=Fodinibius sediminis TaxID=1214077 RepID=A0A521DJ94_9BACT|nr:baseplate J/gp47 family protein [Fodinibius sediminis]SMO71813.1 Baseplate J-like protein [Fodinibius sediminis]